MPASARNREGSEARVSDRGDLSPEQQELAERVLEELADTARAWQRLEQEADALSERHDELVAAARLLGLLATSDA